MTTWISELPCDEVSPAAARSMVHAHAERLGDHCRDVVLLVSELVTNAVRHGRAPITVTLGVEGRLVHVSVGDAGMHERPHLREAGVDGGFGLQMVQTIAPRWGIAEDRSCVWFELDLDVPPRQPSM